MWSNVNPTLGPVAFTAERRPAGRRYAQLDANMTERRICYPFVCDPGGAKPRRRTESVSPMSLPPVDARALAQSGADALRRGDARMARESFERIVAAGQADVSVCLAL